MSIIKIEKKAQTTNPVKKTKKAKTFNREMVSNKKLLLFIIIVGIFLIICALIFRWQTNKKYQGYWCSYVEHSSIVVQLKDGHTKENDEDLLSKVENFNNVISSSYYAKEDYEEELGPNPDLNDAYVITFSSLDSIGTYIEELNKLDYVLKAEQNTAKTDIALYNIQKSSKYTFTNSDAAEEKDLETGKYKIKKGVIIFTPNNKELESKMLYIKADHLCSDPECSRVFAASDSTCGSAN